MRSHKAARVKPGPRSRGQTDGQSDSQTGRHTARQTHIDDKQTYRDRQAHNQKDGITSKLC